MIAVEMEMDRRFCGEEGGGEGRGDRDTRKQDLCHLCITHDRTFSLPFLPPFHSLLEKTTL